MLLDDHCGHGINAFKRMTKLEKFLSLLVIHRNIDDNKQNITHDHHFA